MINANYIVNGTTVLALTSATTVVHVPVVLARESHFQFSNIIDVYMMSFTHDKY